MPGRKGKKREAAALQSDVLSKQRRAQPDDKMARTQRLIGRRMTALWNTEGPWDRQSLDIAARHGWVAWTEAINKRNGAQMDSSATYECCVEIEQFLRGSDDPPRKPFRWVETQRVLGHDPYGRGISWSPVLQSAAKHGHVACLAFLVENGYKFDREGMYYVLRTAVRGRVLSCVRYLCQSGQRIDAPHVYLATAAQDPELLRYVWQHASCEEREKESQQHSVFERAYRRHDLELAKFTVRHGYSGLVEDRDLWSVADERWFALLQWLRGVVPSETWHICVCSLVFNEESCVPLLELMRQVIKGATACAACETELIQIVRTNAPAPELSLPVDLADMVCSFVTVPASGHLAFPWS